MASPAAVLNIVVNANTGKASAALRKFNGELKMSEMQGGRSTRAAEKFSRGVDTAAKVSAGLAAYGLYKAVKAGVTFEKQMSSLGAIAEASAKDMRKLEAQALKLGESTAFTAKEVAIAQTELAKGGLKVKQIYGGGIQAALSLAAAGELELGAAAETTVNAMKLFGLRGKDATKIADMLATAANRTTADVTDFAMALKQGGGVAKLAGLNLNNTVTILEALAEAGVKNSDAGTSLKTSLVQLLKPSEKQAKLARLLNIEWVSSAGNIKNAAGLSKELIRATDEMTKAERAKTFATLAGTDGVRTLNALYDAGPAKLKKLEEANAKQGTAQEVAKKKMDNFQGSLEELQGAAETLGIKVYKVLKPSLEDATEGAADLVREISKVFDDRTLSGPEKFEKAFNLAFNKLLPVFEKVMTGTAEVAAENAPKVALAFVKGFVNAGIWGKLFTAAYLFGKIGGMGAFSKLGKGAGAKFGAAFLAAVLGLELAKEIKRIVEGHELDAPDSEEFAKYLNDYFKVDTAKIVGPNKVKITTAIGNLLFNSQTQKVIWASNEKLQGMVGKIPAEFVTKFNKMQELQGILRRHLRPLPGISGKTAKDIKQSFLPKLTDLVRGGDTKGKEFEEKVGGHFWSLAETSQGAMGNIMESVQSLVSSLSIKMPKGFSVKDGLNMLPPLKKGTAQERYSGGPITKPMAIVGEEAPRHHEWVIATNPAYKKANLGYWAQAGADLGVPGFAKGGAIGHPQITGPEPLRSVGQGAVDKVHESASLLARALKAMASKEGGGGLIDAGPLRNFNHTYPKHSLSETAGKARFSEALTARIARWAGLPGRLFGQIAHGESGFYPGIYGVDPGGSVGYGLWAITKPFNDALVAKYGGYEQMLNPLKNAKVAKAIYDQAGGISPWYGTKYVTGLAKGGLMGSVGGSPLGFQKGGLSKGDRQTRQHVLGELAAASKGWRTLQWDADPLWNWREVWNDLPNRTREFRRRKTNRWLEDHLPIPWSADRFNFIRPGDMGDAPTLARAGFTGPERESKSGGSGNKAMQLLSGTGMVDVPGDGGSGVVSPSIVRLVAEYCKLYDTQVNYGYDPSGHVSPGHLVTGTATDTSPRSGNWTGKFEDGLRLMVSKGFEVGYGTDGIGEAWPNHGRGNHAHTEWVGNGTAADARSRLRNALGGVAGGPVSDGPTAGQEKKAEAAATKKAREARAKQLREKVGKSKTKMGRKTALWDLIGFFGKYGIFNDKEIKQRVLGDVTKVAALKNPLNGIPTLNKLGAFMEKNVTLSGRDEGNFPDLSDKISEARDKGMEIAKKRRSQAFKKIEARGALSKEQRAQFAAFTRTIEELDETVGIKESWFSTESSEAGSDWSDNEATALLGWNEGLLGNLEGKRGFDRATLAQMRERQAKVTKEIKAAQKKTSQTHWKLPALRGEREKIRETIAMLSEDLAEIQGLTGQGGRLNDVRLAIEGITGRKLTDESSGPKEETAGEAYWKDVALKANQRNLIFERQNPIVDAYSAKNFAGMFAKGGSIPAGQWGIVGENGPEPAFGPVEVFPNGTRFAAAASGGVTEVVLVVEDGAVDVSKIRAIANGEAVKVTKAQGKRAKLSSGHTGRGV